MKMQYTERVCVLQRGGYRCDETCKFAMLQSYFSVGEERMGLPSLSYEQARRGEITMSLYISYDLQHWNSVNQRTG